ncbi:hypothetical protein [Streptomyces sp. DHE17-7]|uniref:hypothetical protein n=1 Tax=Streptomyces sp. DHE17-7 TaxID=2759949 RepID=UPI002FCDFEB1
MTGWTRLGELVPRRRRPRTEPCLTVTTARPPRDEPGWPETGAIVGVAGLGAGAVALVLRLKLVRVERG